MSVLGVRVIKVGGSLFDVDDLPQTLADWLGQQPPAHQVLLAGGGPLADFIRDADRRFLLSAARCHWLCVRLLEISGDLLAELLPSAVRVDRYDALRALLAGGAAQQYVFSTAEFLRDYEPHVPGARLAHDWRTTSDSIAARAAQALGAQELVLLKSRPLPRGTSRAAAGRLGLVDVQFRGAAAGLAVRWVNFRQRPPGKGVAL